MLLTLWGGPRASDGEAILQSLILRRTFLRNFLGLRPVRLLQKNQNAVLSSLHECSPSQYPTTTMIPRIRRLQHPKARWGRAMDSPFHGLPAKSEFRRVPSLLWHVKAPCTPLPSFSTFRSPVRPQHYVRHPDPVIRGHLVTCPPPHLATTHSALRSTRIVARDGP